MHNRFMNTLASFLCLGIISLSFLHDHQVNLGDTGQGNRVSEHAPVMRHVHLNEHAAHEPVSKPGHHENNVHWVFVDHVTLTTLTSGPSTVLLPGLPQSDNWPSDDASPLVPQWSWQPTSPVRGSPASFSPAVLSFNYSSFNSERAPPLFS